MLNSQRPLRRNLLSALIQASVVSLFAVSAGHAATLTVTSSADAGPGSLRDAIGAAGKDNVIVFDCSPSALNCPATITLSSQGNNQGFPGPTALAIKGRVITIQGPSSGGVTLQATPGKFGSATSLRHFFVDADASLTLQNVTLSGGLARGGDGGSGYAGGGGGAGLGGAIFSQGELVLSDVTFSANGAQGGNGGAAFSTDWAYGGGGGMGGDGGSQYNGGGGGTGGNGLTGLGNIGGNGGPGLGGGGGGIGTSDGGTDGVGGGGGGGGYNRGGAGSEGGGGGGGAGYNGSGGAGGFGGGGGGARLTGSGHGGFGGGGGGALAGSADGGVGGGHSGPQFISSFGGGAAGFGGAVFARGGTVTVEGTGSNGSIADNGVAGGSGNFAGAAAGTGLFLMSGLATVFDIAGSYTVSDDIADDSATSLPAGLSYMPGTGAGAGIDKQGSGTLILAGNDTYAGATNVYAGILRVTGSIAGSAVGVAASGTLTGDGTTGAIDSFGTLVPGTAANPQGHLTASGLTLESGSLSCFHVAPNSVSQLIVNGTAKLNGIARLDFSISPKVGAKYTLVQAASIVGTFAGYETNQKNLYFDLDSTATTVTATVASSDVLFEDGMEQSNDSPCVTAFTN